MDSATSIGVKPIGDENRVRIKQFLCKNLAKKVTTSWSKNLVESGIGILLLGIIDQMNNTYSNSHYFVSRGPNDMTFKPFESLDIVE